MGESCPRFIGASRNDSPNTVKRTRPYEAVLECARVCGYQATIVRAVGLGDGTLVGDNSLSGLARTTNQGTETS